MNATAVLAVLTVLGGILLVTHRLTSDRPIAPPGDHNTDISEQKIDNRLWEDPFQAIPSQSSAPVKLGTPTNSIVKQQELQVLAVMIPGGPASEDREDRIRSRFAVISALAESGYAPENPMDIGLGAMAWPTTQQLKEHQDCKKWTGQIYYAFESFRREEYVCHPSTTNSQPVLLLWLDENSFDDDPLRRLCLFSTNLYLNTNWFTNGHGMSLIGPSSSSTLRAIFTNDLGEPPLHDPLLTNVELFLATPRAMDEVLIKTNAEAYTGGRAALLSRLGDLFKKPRNFAATDNYLAREALEELLSRGIDLRLTNQQHLVLVACWDQLFGRMLSAAYAAELAVWQTGRSLDETFLQDYHDGRTRGPVNLHTFFYFSGLDGQGLYSNHPSKPAAPERSAAAAADGNRQSAQDYWTPDVNRAEGTSQLDYLGRLADELSKLDQQLMNSNCGNVSAIGIGGGDVYDTLLILQALRPRFPQAVFFTTDLDARFWDPKESPWTRNLVVISGYGLELNAELQGHTPPFRDSQQTAEYAATLAALGNTNLLRVTKIPVRRFEIGRNGPVEMSTSQDPYQPPLQPAREPPGNLWHWLGLRRHWGPLTIILLAGFTMTAILSRYFRRYTFDRYRFLAEPLWLQEEDVGGLAGLRKIASELTPAFCSARPQTEKAQAEKVREIIVAILSRPGLSNLEERLQFLMPEVLDAWNGVLAEASSPLQGQAHLIRGRKHLDRLDANRKEADRIIMDLLISQGTKPEPPSEEDQFTYEWAAQSAHKVSRELFALRCLESDMFLFLAAMAIVIGICALGATVADPTQAFFSGTSVWPTTWICFLSGVLSLLFLQVSFFRLRRGFLETTRECRLVYRGRATDGPAGQKQILGTHYIREAWHAFREWKDWVSMPAVCDPVSFVHANSAWAEYQKKGNGWCRTVRSVLLAALFLALIQAVYYFLFRKIYHPFLREPAASWYTHIMWVAYYLFLFLSFWTIDAARLCRWFVQRISQGPTLYPLATRQHFSSQRGQIPYFVLGEWIDVHIIAMISNRVSRLIYFPSVTFFLLILAHHTVFYNWAWPPSYFAMSACNLVVSAASIVILQRAAIWARDQSEKSLEKKLNKLKAETPETEQQLKQHTVDEAERLLQEIRNLKHGAFAGFWGNPVVGALLVPSGGTAVIEILRLIAR